MGRKDPAPPKTLEESVAAVCRIAGHWREQGNISWNDLVAASGYSTHREAITEERIEAHLRSHPQLVDDWIVNSEDQRFSPAWWIASSVKSGSTQWTVGYYFGHKSDWNQERAFEDQVRACAYFIKRKLEPAPRPGWGSCLTCLGIMLGIVLLVGIVLRIAWGPPP